MTQPKLTPCIARAAAKLYDQRIVGGAYTRNDPADAGQRQEAEIDAKTALTAGLAIDPDDPDWLARQLYVLNNTHDGTTIPRWTPEEALRVWNSLSDDAWVKVHYRMMADGLRILITGEPT